MDVTPLTQAVTDPQRVRTRPLDRAVYSGDASHYRMTPAAVVEAADAQEVAAILRKASGAHLPVTFRSGGTSLSGQASTTGVMVDVRGHFRGFEVLDDGRRVRVQPGATVGAVNARLAAHHTRLGPDPASEVACTVGGVVSNNSSGMAAGTTQNTYRTMESMVFVLPSGTRIDSAAPDAAKQLAQTEPLLVMGLLALRDRVRSNPESVATIKDHFALKNTMGYGINAFLDFDEPLDILTHLIIGSEGTLAFVAETTFHTVPIHALVSTALTVFPTLDAATRALPALVESGAATLELMDSTSLRVGQHLPGAPEEILGFDPGARAALLVEYRGDEGEKLCADTANATELLSTMGLHSPAQFSADPARRARAWSFRKGLYATVAGARHSGTTALLEDIVVPTPRLADTCAGLQTLFGQFGYDDSVIFGHAKDGNIHFMLTDRFEGKSAIDRYTGFQEGMVDLVLGAGGNLKAEHGTGRAMAPFVRRQYGDELYEVMQELKHLCDPEGIMNPGVIRDEDPKAHIRDIKLNPTVEDEVDRCVECGYCESVCPSRDLTLTPRQRIIARRVRQNAVATGDMELVEDLDRDYTYDGVETCAVDGMCQTACPVGINTGDLVRRLRREDEKPVWAAGWAGAAGAWAPVSRAASLGLSVAGALPASLVEGATVMAQKVLGSDNIPRWTPDLPGGGKARRPMGRLVGAKTGRAVGIYLPACVSSMFGESHPEGETQPAPHTDSVRDAFVELLEDAGLTLLVPAGIEGLCCGTPWSSKGFPSGHEIMAHEVVARVSAAMQGAQVPVISDASSCTEGFAKILADTEFEVMDALTFTAREILPRLGEVPTKAATLTLHPTCSSTAMGLNDDLRTVAEAVAQDVRVPLDWGCCAFAGDRGMLHPELTASATAREAVEVGELDSDLHASCNRTCEVGMTRATGRDYRHVLELLADSVRAGCR